MVTKDELKALLDRASRAPCGLRVKCNDPDMLRRKLYPIRALDPLFADLSFKLKHGAKDELWITRKVETDGGLEGEGADSEDHIEDLRE